MDGARTWMSRRTMLGGLAATLSATEERWQTPELPDPLITEAYDKAARQNVLAAVNPQVFEGYWSVCADGRGFGYGNTYPSLDGHQMTDALLWLGQVETVRANWDYVRKFQREDGSLPLAILPSQAGKTVGPSGYTAAIDANGGLYRHWVPGNPLAALASPTLIQNADAIYRRTLDVGWLRSQVASIEGSAGFLESLTTKEGAVKGGGYYVERPTRLECDGVTQPHAMDAFQRVAALKKAAGGAKGAVRWEEAAARVRRHFVREFWRGDRFAEYWHPQRGYITAHGYTDTDWAALAHGAATKEQAGLVWKAIRSERRFYYGGMPAGIATEPENYEAWEFAYPDRMDLAAMGRVWYLECAARARMNDAAGLIDSVRRVCEMGRANGYYWRERYGAKGGYGAEKYCEYPANLIRIVHRHLLGTELCLDGSVRLAPVVPAEFEEKGFGQRLNWLGRVLEYRIRQGRIRGSYEGAEPLKLSVKLRGERVLTLKPGARFDAKIQVIG